MQFNVIWLGEDIAFESAILGWKLACEAEHGWTLRRPGGVVTYLKREEALDLAYDPAYGFRQETPRRVAAPTGMLG